MLNATGYGSGAVTMETGVFVKFRGKEKTTIFFDGRNHKKCSGVVYC